MASMAASSRCSPEGYVFAPSDEKLVQFLYDKVLYGHDHPGAPIVEYDLYGEEEPWEMWSKFGGGGGDGFDGRREKDLYFFTKLKKLSPKGGGSHHRRRVGDGGAWSSARSFPVSTKKVVSRDGAPIDLNATMTHLRYEKDGSPHHGAWLLAEFSLGHLNTRSRRYRALDGQFVLCRLRKKYKPPPKSPQVPPLAAAGHYHHQQPMSNHAAVGSKKPRKRSSGTTHGSSNDQANDVVPVTETPRKRPDLGGQESACDRGSTILVGDDRDRTVQEEERHGTWTSASTSNASVPLRPPNSSLTCCYSAAASTGVDQGTSEIIDRAVQEEERDAAWTSASTSNASVQLRPPNSSLTERTPMTFYSPDDQVFSDQGYQHSDGTGTVAMTTTNITSTESSDPPQKSRFSCLPGDEIDWDTILGPANQEFTDQLYWEWCYDDQRQ